MSEIKKALKAARDIVDACAGDNRPATGWAAKVRTQIDAALSSAPVAEREPVAQLYDWTDDDGETQTDASTQSVKSVNFQPVRNVRPLYLDPPPNSELEAEIARLRVALLAANARAEDQWAGWVKEGVARKAAEARLAEALKALDGLLEPFEGDDCRYDHHGYCQAHFLQEGDECCVKIARSVREGWKVDG